MRSAPEPAPRAFAALDHVVELRQTNRRQFADEPVPARWSTRSRRQPARRAPSSSCVRDEDQRLAVARLSQHADAGREPQPGLPRRAARLDHRRPARGCDGVPGARPCPHVDAGSGDEVPDPRLRHPRHRRAARRRPVRRGSQCLVLLCTRGDAASTGCGPARRWNGCCWRSPGTGSSASPLTQVTEVPSARAQLRRELAHRRLPARAAASRPGARHARVHAARRLVDVLVEES